MVAIWQDNSMTQFRDFEGSCLVFVITFLVTAYILTCKPSQEPEIGDEARNPARMWRAARSSEVQRHECPYDSACAYMPLPMPTPGIGGIVGKYKRPAMAHSAHVAY